MLTRGLRISCAKTFQVLMAYGVQTRKEVRHSLPLTREEKEDLVAKYTEKLQSSRALLVTDYRGLNTTEITKLRRQVSEADAEFMVIKNRLFRLAMKDVGLDIPEDFLMGPVAAGFCYGDVPPVAKALTDFAEDTEILVVRGGLLDENFLSEAEITALANLPSMDVLRAQLLGLLQAPMSNIAGVMASSVRQMVNLLAAYGEKGENGAEAPSEAEAEAPHEDTAGAEQAASEEEQEAPEDESDSGAEEEAEAEPEAEQESDDEGE